MKAGDMVNLNDLVYDFDRFCKTVRVIKIIKITPNIALLSNKVRINRKITKLTFSNRLCVTGYGNINIYLVEKPVIPEDFKEIII